MFGTVGALSRLGAGLSLDYAMGLGKNELRRAPNVRSEDNANRLAYRTFPTRAEASLQQPV
jgi:hypothetical protein